MTLFETFSTVYRNFSAKSGPNLLDPNIYKRFRLNPTISDLFPSSAADGAARVSRA